MTYITGGVWYGPAAPPSDAPSSPPGTTPPPVPVDCGITDAFGRSDGPGWSISDAGLVWQNDITDFYGEPPSPAAAISVDGNQGVAVFGDNGFVAATAEFLNLPERKSTWHAKVHCVISAPLTDPDNDFSTGTAWLQFYHQHFAEGPPDTQFVDGGGDQDANVTVFRTVNLSTFLDDTYTDELAIGTRAANGLTNTFDGMTLPDAGPSASRSFWLEIETFSDGCRVRSWLDDDAVPDWQLEQHPESGLNYGSVALEMKNGGTSYSGDTGHDITFKWDNLEVDGLDACSCVTTIIHDEFTRTTTPGWQGPAAAIFSPGNNYPTWDAADAFVYTDGSSGVIKASLPLAAIRTSQLVYGPSLKTQDMLIVGSTDRTLLAGDVIQVFAGVVAPDVVITPSTIALNGIGGSDSVGHSVDLSLGFRLRFDADVAGNATAAIWQDGDPEPPAQVTIPSDPGERYDEVTIRNSIGSGHADLYLSIDDFYVEGGSCAGTGGGAVLPPAVGAAVPPAGTTVFGGDPTGVTDVSSAMLAYLSAGGNRAFVPYATYRCDNRIQLNGLNDWHLYGQGATINGKGIVGAIKDTILRFVLCNRFTVEDLTIVGEASLSDVTSWTSWARENEHNFMIDGCTDAVLRQCRGTNAWGDGLDIAARDSTHNSDRVTIDTCYFGTSGRNNISVTGGRNILISYCTLTSAGLANYDAEPNNPSDYNTNVAIRHTDFRLTDLGDTPSRAGSGYALYLSAGNHEASNYVVDSCTGDKIDIYLQAPSGYTNTNITITNNVSDAPATLHVTSTTGLVTTPSNTNIT